MHAGAVPPPRNLCSVSLARKLAVFGELGPIVLHPLVGGMPVDEAWKSVELLADKVVPALT